MCENVKYTGRKHTSVRKCILSTLEAEFTLYHTHRIVLHRTKALHMKE